MVFCLTATRLMPSLLRTLTFAAALAAAGASCTRQSPDTSVSDDASALFESVPAATPVVFTAYLSDGVTDTPKEWLMEDREGLAVIEGDIVVGAAAEFTSPGLGLKSLQYLRARLWTKGVVPYVLAPDFPRRSVVLAAMEDFHRRTPIKFVARSNEPDYLVFTLTDNPAIGGQSFYGRQGGAQSLWLNRNTRLWKKGVVLHELCHALTVAHEQSRADRDQFIRLERQNIMPGYAANFDQLFDAGRDVGDYDYGSIMHYPRNAFGLRGRTTIVPLRPGVTIGQRDQLSERDIAGLAAIYAAELAAP